MPQKIIDADPTQPIESAAAALQLAPSSVLLLLGDYDPALDGQVQSVMSRVIVPAALDPGALIVDGARASGCAAAAGRAAADEDRVPRMLGIIPHERAAADIDANHELVLRLSAACSDSGKATSQIVDQLARNGAGRKPVLAVLFGGQEAERKAAVRCARHGWPVLVIGKTGGVADQIAAAATRPADGATAPVVTDPDVREIVESGIIYTAPLDAAIDTLSQIVIGHIDAESDTSASILQAAWARFDQMDSAARVRQRRFRSLELATILLAVLAALLSILTVAAPAKITTLLHSWRVPDGTLHFLVILTPITIAILRAYNSHFRDGTKWILLRGAAESLKSEIFRFRSSSGPYKQAQCAQASPSSKLAAKVKEITTSLEQTEVNKTSLELVPLRDPKRETFLSAEDYLTVRVQDQVAFFTRKTRRLTLQLFYTQILIYIAGGAGTLLAAIKLDLWVALATAVVTGLSNKLQVDQVESSLAQYNQTLAGLQNVATWWAALSRWEKQRQNNIDLLVDLTERTLEYETAGWVHQMESAFDKLTEKEPDKRAS